MATGLRGSPGPVRPGVTRWKGAGASARFRIVLSGFAPGQQFAVGMVMALLKRATPASGHDAQAVSPAPDSGGTGDPVLERAIDDAIQDLFTRLDAAKAEAIASGDLERLSSPFSLLYPTMVRLADRDRDGVEPA